MTTHTPSHPSRLRDLSADECWQHLTDQRLGRIAYVVDGRPVVVPLNYLAADGLIWLKTASYTELAIHLPGQQAAFSVDHADEHTHTGWSVLVQGRAEHVLGAHPLVEDPASELSPWPEGTRSMVFCLTPDTVSGRLLRQADVSPAAGRGPGTIQRS